MITIQPLRHFLDILPLVFSSKRGGRSDFNFVRELLKCTFDRKTGQFSVNNSPYSGLDVVQELAPTNELTSVVNSGGNELGPYLLSFDHDINKNLSPISHYGEYLMLFASDRTGNLDIYLTHNYRPTSTTNVLLDKTFSAPAPIPFLNSTADDGYPTFDKTFGAIYFTSNREGAFAIYKAALPTISTEELHTTLPNLTNIPVERVAELASSGDTKCPYISGNTLVFTSNRPGGYGGYDLYYSHWMSDHWSAPTNFGPAINTASDEYRPILHDSGSIDFSNQMMVFSSNRPGGKGGFDLYLVGVPK